MLDRGRSVDQMEGPKGDKAKEDRLGVEPARNRANGFAMEPSALASSPSAIDDVRGR